MRTIRKGSERVLLRCSVSRHTPRRMAGWCTCFSERIWLDHLTLRFSLSLSLSLSLLFARERFLPRCFVRCSSDLSRSKFNETITVDRISRGQRALTREIRFSCAPSWVLDRRAGSFFSSKKSILNTTTQRSCCPRCLQRIVRFVIRIELLQASISRSIVI